MHSNYQAQQHAMLQASNGISQAAMSQQQILLQQQLQQQGQMRQIPAGSQPKQRVFTGTVTKMHDNFGFVDEDVFFQLNSCEGKIPSVGDRVLVEAQFNPNMPFKWNATRVQIIAQQAQSQNIPAQVSQLQAFNMQGQPQHIYTSQRVAQPQGLTFTSAAHGGAGLLGPAPVNVMNVPQKRHQQMSKGKGHKRNAARSGGRDHRSPPPRNRARSGEKSARKKRSRTPPPRKRSLSPVHRRSVSTEHTVRHPAPRYMVKFVKHPLDRKSSDVLEVKNFCPNLYIPSDFIKVKYNWLDSFTLQQPLSTEKCQFHVCSKDVEPLVKLDDEMLSPPDLDHSWTARVMLLQVPTKKELYAQSCGLAEDSSENFLHPSRLYQFLLGYKSKKEPVAIGGSWSPSLDGPDPASNPFTLIKTAMRTCRALTGIDLSKCTKWYRMLEIQYHRDAETRKGREIPARVETTVVFLPDVHSCMPTSSEYSALCSSYLEKFQEIAEAEQSSDKEKPRDVAEADSKPVTKDDAATDLIDQKEEKEEKEKEEPPDVKKTPEKLDTETKSADVSMEEEGLQMEVPSEVTTPHTKLDIKSLKVDSLRKELEARGLSPKGLKSVLVTRLKNALKEEEEKVNSDLDKTEEDIKMEVKMDQEESEEQEEAASKEEQSSESTKEKKADEEKTEDGKESHDTKVEDQKSKEKNDKEKEKKKKVEAEQAAKKRKVDLERLKRHYRLPESHPIIPVHPNPTYRKGRYECATASLSTLLSYRQDDNKESIFEVSLFAEAFNEMLQRGFAFNIYKSLCNPLPQLKKEDEEKESDTKGEEVDEEGEKKRKIKEESEEEPKAKRSKSESDEKEEEKEKNDEKESDRKGREGSKTDDDQSNKKRSGSKDSKDSRKHEKSSKDKDTKSKRKSRHSSKSHSEKMVSLRPELLLSFVYFDQTHCGYIHESDVADIIHSVGLGLSRSQISKLVSKFTDRDSLHYRKFTDVPESQVEAFKELLQNVEDIDVDSLVNGNEILMPESEKMEAEDEKIPAAKKGIVMYKGAVVDVGSLQEKLKSSEENRTELEETLQSLKQNLESTNKHLSVTQKDKKQLETDLEAAKKKLAEAQTNYKSASETRNKYEKTLKSIMFSAEGVLPKVETQE